MSGSTSVAFPDADSLAALRAWFGGFSSRAAVVRFLPDAVRQGRSARGVLGEIRRALAAFALHVGRTDLIPLIMHPSVGRTHRAKAIASAIDALRHAPIASPQITDRVEQWLSQRSARVLHAFGIRTLADLTVRIPRRRQWWTVIPGLGIESARRIEMFFAEHPCLTERARALIAAERGSRITPWEHLYLPRELDGSFRTFRAPLPTCVLDASNDYEAVQAWISLHESSATQRTYRKEAERLILWAVVERQRALSSLTTEDAIAFRSFLRRPVPRDRWVGPTRSRRSPDWRPFEGSLSDRSIAQAIAILAGLFRWLIEQRYVVANPFSGVRVRRGARSNSIDTARAFTTGEWMLLRTLADGIEWSNGWQTSAAQRLRFLLDFGFATGLRSSELVGATLGHIRSNARGEHWLMVTGKGGKRDKVVLPPLAWGALTQYLLARGLPVAPERWRAETLIIGRLNGQSVEPISGERLWAILRRFFHQAAHLIEADHTILAGKLRRASPHWMRHTHATYGLAHGAELTTVRDNLRHASISTTSIYVHSDETTRVQQITAAFGVARSWPALTANRSWCNEPILSPSTYAPSTFWPRSTVLE
ncbi:phage integrase family protein [Caballeronia arvi]|uniref:Phage integrase family protein n=1 Tax=Caballeronia arvi TaxID=1777135 RepID=A0A158KLJ1_9BURK|nr:phage integrase family protein [Caballeronia arvi]